MADRDLGLRLRFVARHSGKCLHVPSTSSKVQLTQQACNGSSNQQGGSTANGALAQQWGTTSESHRQ